MKSLIKKRTSVRNFTEETIAKGIIEEVLRDAQTAPSAGNLQPYRAYYTTDKKKIKQLANAAMGQSWIEEAPLVFVICENALESCAKYTFRGSQYATQDATIFSTFLDLLFVERGYGTCWVGAIMVDVVKMIMEIDILSRPLHFLVVGRTVGDKWGAVRGKSRRKPLHKVAIEK